MKNLMKQLWADENGQGATEYILLLVIVVGVALTFRRSIMETLGNKLQELAGSIGAFTSEGQ